MISSEKISKPDHTAVKKSIVALCHIDSKLKNIIDDEDIQQTIVKNSIKTLSVEKVQQTLKDIGVEQINKNKQGIRISALKDAGILNIWQLYNLSLQQIYNIHGVGEQTAYKIKNAVDNLVKSVGQSISLRISKENCSESNENLIQALYILVNSKDIRNQCRTIYQNNHDNIQTKITAAKKAQSGFTWFFSTNTKKNQAINSLQEVNALLKGKYNETTSELFSQYQDIISNQADCWNDFETKSSKYYAMLETVDSSCNRGKSIQNGLPAQMAQEIENYPLDLQFLKATLRRYQEFGVKYILNQEKVLLGDEMGLGKTVQAIAAMAALKASGETHFMVVCPVSVLVNWCREVELHSNMNAVKIHKFAYLEMIEWIADGGVAITTYETIRKLILPENFVFSILVVDEAHYVKNPNALRTTSLIKLLEKTDRALFMTGTPLENNVDEMCFLVSCLQPSVAYQIENIKQLSTAPQFREKLAPVYLRRTRDDVLQELPDLIESEEWCEMSNQEIQAYYDSVMSRNFMTMRQVSWQLNDISQSSKAQRLQELCQSAKDENKKVIVYSFFRDTISKVCRLLGDQCLEPITGSVSPQKRQEIIDEFTKAIGSKVLVSQVQAGGIGLNIQTASVVIFCEPQLKPSIENQAISRAYRMGQIRNVFVYRLLCEDCIDKHIIEILRNKQEIFDNFADESVIGVENIKKGEKSWINKMVDEERIRLDNLLITPKQIS